MEDEVAPDEFDQRPDSRPADGDPSDDQLAWTDAPSLEESAPSFREQILSGSWQIRVPVTFEIYAEGWLPQIHSLESGQRARYAASTPKVTSATPQLFCFRWNWNFPVAGLA